MIHAAIREGVFSPGFAVKNSPLFTRFLATRKSSQVSIRLDSKSVMYHTGAGGGGLLK
jgi:hypothetical protein